MAHQVQFLVSSLKQLKELGPVVLSYFGCVQNYL